MKENTDYEMIAGTGENWDIRILTGEFNETVLAFQYAERLLMMANTSLSTLILCQVLLMILMQIPTLNYKRRLVLSWRISLIRLHI